MNVVKHGLVLEKRDLAFEIEGVLNPAVIVENGKIHMFYRAVALGNRSTLGYCTFANPLEVDYRMDKPCVVPEFDYEKHGVEDPRIVKIDDTYYLSYCGYDGKHAFGCVATSSDMKKFHKHGIIVPKYRAGFLRSGLASQREGLNIKYFQPVSGDDQYVWDKNVVFFPRRLNGKLTFLHRIRPGMQMVQVDSLDEIGEKFWEKYLSELKKNIVLDPKYAHELSYIGNGAPPIETADGWLLIYHGVHDTVEGYMYVACAALLDLDDPTKEIARLPHALFYPDKEWELKGYVDYVTFPTGTAVVDDTLYMYYGAADERIACASVKLEELLLELKKYRIQ
ncbi:pesticidal protein Cry7Aa [Flavobacterium sp. MAH-1]|uniref:Pesticidal protein Cry7Aa n=1 Tax=Flavobacterium agri TaxID=2743471 RepID=A0A7Y8Y4P7_9FLAO|nr:pesticidal protein Cry7Aa [Flavobacterium agri]NUY82452.1 pesticidal protein Cry7Aa [Flavobacterium agri]NYA72476.1 pesticidal protein Cry7Aa [Flavobacterium agri]